MEKIKLENLTLTYKDANGSYTPLKILIYLLTRVNLYVLLVLLDAEKVHF